LEIKFKTKLLEKCYREHRRAVKEFGEDVARKYIQRINIIDKATNLDELKHFPGLRCHALSGNRQGQHAINLTGFHRLIFRLEGERLQIVCIEEVSKHYDD
jgi:proteic killer suppression protein